jgi:hypothetical protein
MAFDMAFPRGVEPIAGEPLRYGHPDPSKADGQSEGRIVLFRMPNSTAWPKFHAYRRRIRQSGQDGGRADGTGKI